MSTSGTIVSSAAGLVLVALALRDVFDALFHPAGRGRLSHAVMRSVWATFRRVGRARPVFLQLAGPAALVGVVVLWAGLLVVGWALIFWPHLPEDFHASGPPPEGFGEAVHFSLVTVTTLGYGDVVPADTWLRIVAPLEALLGFGVLSASISWLLLLPPVLLRRRALAYELTLLSETAPSADALAERFDPQELGRVCAELMSRLVAVERDLVAFPVAYYFGERDARFSLARTAPFLLELAEGVNDSDLPSGVRLRAEMLLRAIEDFAATT